MPDEGTPCRVCGARYTTPDSLRGLTEAQREILRYVGEAAGLELLQFEKTREHLGKRAIRNEKMALLQTRGPYILEADEAEHHS